MLAHPTQSEFEARCNATYDALLWALSRPGLDRRLPQPGAQVIVEALIDRECAVHCDGEAMTQCAARTGAAIVPADQADHVFLDGPAQPEIIAQLRIGSDMYPDDGATLVTHAAIGRGQALRLTGPGVDGSVEVQIDLPAAIWPARDAAMRYPMGFDMIIVDGDRVIGLPRTTLIEVL